MAIRSLVLIGALFLVEPLYAADEAAPESPAAEAVSEGEREYQEKLQKLNSLELKVAEAELQFAALVQAKNKTKVKREALDIIEQMKVLRVQRDADVAKFNEVRDEIQFKYPDMGRAVQQRFAPMQKKTVEQLERSSTLDADLTAAQKAAARVYRPFNQAAEEKERAEAERESGARLPSRPAVVEKKEAPPKIRLVK
jgi:hypothetical protein